MREYYGSCMSERECPVCHGSRLNENVLSVRINGKNINDVCSLSIGKCYEFFQNLTLTPTEHKIGDLVIQEIKNRLKFLLDVGLDYLTLSREAGTLSGGESQRIRLATQIGSRLTGVLYVEIKLSIWEMVRGSLV